MPVLPPTAVGVPNFPLYPGSIPFIVHGSVVPFASIHTVTVPTTTTTGTETETVVIITPTSGLDKRWDEPNWQLIRSTLVESTKLALKIINEKLRDVQALLKNKKWRLSAALKAGYYEIDEFDNDLPPPRRVKASYKDAIELRPLVAKVPPGLAPYPNGSPYKDFNEFFAQVGGEPDSGSSAAVLGKIFASLADDLGPEFVDQLVADLEPASEDLLEFASLFAQANDVVGLANLAALQQAEESGEAAEELLELVLTIEQEDDEEPVGQIVGRSLLETKTASSPTHAESTPNPTELKKWDKADWREILHQVQEARRKAQQAGASSTFTETAEPTPEPTPDSARAEKLKKLEELVSKAEIWLSRVEARHKAQQTEAAATSTITETAEPTPDSTRAKELERLASAMDIWRSKDEARRKAQQAAATSTITDLRADPSHPTGTARQSSSTKTLWEDWVTSYLANHPYPEPTKGPVYKVVTKTVTTTETVTIEPTPVPVLADPSAVGKRGVDLLVIPDLGPYYLSKGPKFYEQFATVIPAVSSIAAAAAAAAAEPTAPPAAVGKRDEMIRSRPARIPEHIYLSKDPKFFEHFLGGTTSVSTTTTTTTATATSTATVESAAGCTPPS
ncbi:hypothetical protein QBC37DRAFT_393949 [Rhypophila decipiens]|uniref:Uncharacterized protein n=1 Tax=Rhypophila decipiens TaxID=261697 RepID=A0AAN6YK08_9PEZI|nr:hypothetical protein QBC37DRAFT_393949 [Rhypophila decipiens]